MITPGDNAKEFIADAVREIWTITAGNKWIFHLITTVILLLNKDPLPLSSIWQ